MQLLFIIAVALIFFQVYFVFISYFFLFIEPKAFSNSTRNENKNDKKLHERQKIMY